MKIIIEDARATINVRMNRDMAAILPLLEGRKGWLKDGRFSFEPTPKNLDTFQEAFPGLEIDGETTRRTVAGEDLAFDPGRPPYKEKTLSFPHQKMALDLCAKKGAFALFAEQGTGKTKIAIDKAGGHWCRGEITAVLIVAPKGVHRQWIDFHIPEHIGKMVEWTGAFWRGKGTKLPPELNDTSKLRFLSMNYDAVKTDDGLKVCRSFIDAHEGNVFIIADESHNIKNASSKRWKAMAAIGPLASVRMILSGTPIAKDLCDEWAQLKWLDESIIGNRYLTSFRNEYCIMGGFEGRQVIGHRNIARFRAKVDPHSFRVEKKDLGMLPKVYEELTFDLAPKQKEMFKTMRKELIAQIDSEAIVTAANAAVGVMKLQQIASGFITDEDKKPHSLFTDLTDNPRLVAMKEWLENIDGKVIIWARFQYDVELICSFLGSDAVHYYGKTSDADRKANLDAFINGKPICFVSTPGAGGTGLDGLQKVCSRAMYYSNGDNSIQRWQSEDRIHRIGMHGAAIYTDLIGVGTTDRKQLRNLANKKAISDMGLGEIREWLADFNDDGHYSSPNFQEILNGNF